MRIGMILVVVLSLVVFSSVPVHADDPIAKDAGKVDKEIPKDKIDLFKGTIDLMIYTIVVFLILFVVLYKFAWKAISEGLDKREQSIAHDRKEADRARQEAAQMRHTLESERARANEEIRLMMDKARADAQATATEELARGKAEAAAEKERQKREAAREEAQARQNIINETAALATLLSAKVIKKNLSEADHRALIDEALNEFRAAASTRKSDIESARA